jgi:hypothetical protein
MMLGFGVPYEGNMEDDDLVVLSRDRSTWTEEQKKYHDNMPWLGRQFSDLLLRFPGFSRWLATRVMNADEQRVERLRREASKRE